uniref:Probable splicing factor YJU2B n=1 Tax=Catharus ustulatus TaxID=91951 RepID=A0A8C3Y334_CATUS
MGERKGTNKYYPPDFDPAKHGSLNKYHRSHPLRERARKLSQGILVIRFEMPFNIWCDGCQNHIGMGERLLGLGDSGGVWGGLGGSGGVSNLGRGPKGVPQSPGGSF